MKISVNKIHLGLILWLACCLWLPAQNIQITSVTADGTVTWTQDLADAIATVEWSTNVGVAPWLPIKTLFVSNQVCTAQIPVGQPVGGCYRILEADVSQVPSNMCLVPAGYFQMGDSYLEVPLEENGVDPAIPVHTVYVSSYYEDKFEVDNTQMCQTLQWALSNGLITANSTYVSNLEGQVELLMTFGTHDGSYPSTWMIFSNGLFSISNAPGYYMSNFPATCMSWFGALAFCNYRSDMEGLPRCINFTNWTCDFTKKGYRIPTEAEWEKGARGGLTGQHYPWPSYGGIYEDFINGGLASYDDSGDPFRYVAETVPVGYFNGNQINYGTNVHVNVANGYGMYDSVGNVWNWCWDNWQDSWYSQAGATQPNPTGPVDLNNLQVIRGGSVGYYSPYLLCACRHTAGWSKFYEADVVGMRCVRLAP
jgi:formylglycine-generating enzyme required for sulfatase activity